MKQTKKLDGQAVTLCVHTGGSQDRFSSIYTGNAACASKSRKGQSRKTGVDEAPAPHKEKLPPVPNHQPALSFCTSVKDLILIVFLSLVLSVLTAPSRRKGKEGRPEKGSGDWKGRVPFLWSPAMG